MEAGLSGTGLADEVAERNAGARYLAAVTLWIMIA